MPELRHLRAFVAVAEELNFTRAAERLMLAQQAVSKQVAQLERELGVELLERTSREVRLTAAGQALLADGSEVLAAADAAFASAREHGRGLVGQIRIGATTAVGPALSDHAVRRLREEAPGLSVAVVELRPAAIAGALQDRDVDVVLVRASRPTEGVEAVALPPTPAALALPAGHRLADAAALDLAAVDGERLMTWSPPGTPYSDMLVALCAAAGGTVTPVESAVTGGTALIELATLEAVALVPEGWPAGTDVSIVPLRDDVALPLFAVRRPGPAPPTVTRLLALLADP